MLDINHIPESWEQMEPKKVRTDLSNVRNPMSEIDARISDQPNHYVQEHAKEQAQYNKAD